MNSKNLYIVIAGIIILLLGAFIIVSNSNKSAVNSIGSIKTSQIENSVTVKMQDGTFVPDKITIKKLKWMKMKNLKN